MDSHDLGLVSVPMAASRGDAQSALAWRDLHRAASAHYRRCGQFSWHFARGKLKHDPVFRALLERAIIAPGSRVLDIGCGQALLAALLAECDALAAANRWPAAWGTPPSGTRYTGLELMSRDIARAESALATLPVRPQLVRGDMRGVAFEPCDVVVILDVLHYVDVAAQDDVLARARRALQPGGRLLLRVGDPSRRARFAISRWVDHAVTWARGHRAPPTAWRSMAQWLAALQRLGFSVRALPMSQGTPFANVLLVCDLPRGSP
jgi:SAM-dependent methyltransferase